ncbi:PREDICTED: 39S ribosomal protein L53, mitochondrial [Papilio xuthus]|uniref:Large ribosomal subunit protein mL53 n=1 Tax=Papilio xuthus TaxID=66420 RepID=A0A194PNS4_PAPXU|nr:PREDICTED: 39S ribosomal protein L53, mitochondrial [Papilio xuthus]KPI94967.1 39S ribosomal protein L53, mitochondrial [Papilio xuthus]
MSIPYSGTVRRSGGVVSAIAKQLRGVNLKAAKRITVKFDPFSDNVGHTRNFLHLISSPKIAVTNPNCSLKTEVVCDRSEPTINISIAPLITETAKVKNVVIKSGNLTCLEILQLLNKHISSLAPVEQVSSVVQTKSEKKKTKKK